VRWKEEREGEMEEVEEREVERRSTAKGKV
jgi:hypothetical protein